MCSLERELIVCEEYTTLIFRVEEYAKAESCRNRRQALFAASAGFFAAYHIQFMMFCFYFF
jgi:hypothetical protein